MPSPAHLAPPLLEAAPDDPTALRALAAEQAARLAVIRDAGIWEWLGGLPSVVGDRVALFCGLGAMLALPVTLVGLAMFSDALFMWAGGAFVVLLLVSLVRVQPARWRRRGMYRRAELLPVAFVAFEAARAGDDDQRSGALALVDRAGWQRGEVLPLHELAQRLRARRSEAGFAPLAMDPACAVTGRRHPLPAALAGRDGVELVELEMRFGLWRAATLWFALVDPGRRGPGSALAVSDRLFGDGGTDLIQRTALVGEGA